MPNQTYEDWFECACGTMSKSKHRLMNGRRACIMCWAEELEKRYV